VLWAKAQARPAVRNAAKTRSFIGDTEYMRGKECDCSEKRQEGGFEVEKLMSNCALYNQYS
jgi:hypothetical protein